MARYFRIDGSWKRVTEQIVHQSFSEKAEVCLRPCLTQVAEGRYVFRIGSQAHEIPPFTVSLPVQGAQ
jgi:hypothetical protein